MNNLLRATRWLVALIVSAHVALLRCTAAISEGKARKACQRTDQARAGLRFAQDAVRYARVNVAEFREAEIRAQADARNTKVAAEAECKYWGREL